uniref:Uncharacterized protein n=1 Tax=Arundo donax TaxID=35708 RepID=A0A0A9ACA8_ARUDO
MAWSMAPSSSSSRILLTKKLLPFLAALLFRPGNSSSGVSISKPTRARPQVHGSEPPGQ